MTELNDEALYYLAQNMREKLGAVNVPEEYFAFLKQSGGFKRGDVELYGDDLMRMNQGRYIIPEAVRGGVFNDPPADFTYIHLGRCADGFYAYRHQDNSYHLKTGGYITSFDSCADMLHHAIDKARNESEEENPMFNQDDLSYRVNTHLHVYPWLRQPYEELTRLSGEISSLALNKGHYTFVEDYPLGNGQDNIIFFPRDYYAFLWLVDGFRHNDKMVIYSFDHSRDVNDPSPEHEKLQRRGHTMSREVDGKFSGFVDDFVIGTCDHGTYRYNHTDGAYYLDLINGGRHQFGGCADMLNHIIIRIQENR
jgi:hypothetical protein